MSFGYRKKKPVQTCFFNSTGTAWSPRYGNKSHKHIPTKWRVVSNSVVSLKTHVRVDINVKSISDIQLRYEISLLELFSWLRTSRHDDDGDVCNYQPYLVITASLKLHSSLETSYNQSLTIALVTGDVWNKGVVRHDCKCEPTHSRHVTLS